MKRAMPEALTAAGDIFARWSDQFADRGGVLTVGLARDSNMTKRMIEESLEVGVFWPARPAAIVEAIALIRQRRWLRRTWDEIQPLSEAVAAIEGVLSRWLQESSPGRKA